MKRSTDDLSVRDELDAAPPGDHLPLGLGRWAMRGMKDFSVEELAQLHQKLEGWMGQRTHDPKHPQRRPWIMKPNTAHPV